MEPMDQERKTAPAGARSGDVNRDACTFEGVPMTSMQGGPDERSAGRAE